MGELAEVAPTSVEPPPAAPAAPATAPKSDLSPIPDEPLSSAAKPVVPNSQEAPSSMHGFPSPNQEPSEAKPVSAELLPMELAPKSAPEQASASSSPASRKGASSP